LLYSAELSDGDVPDKEPLFIELADGALDTHTIVVGTLSDVRVATIRSTPASQSHALLWQGVMRSDGSGPQPNGYLCDCTPMVRRIAPVPIGTFAACSAVTCSIPASISSVRVLAVRADMAR
jgi:hypothetical protein